MKERERESVCAGVRKKEGWGQRHGWEISQVADRDEKCRGRGLDLSSAHCDDPIF